MAGFHKGRLHAARGDVLNAQVRRIEREASAEEFFQFAWLALGLKEAHYPVATTPESWQAIYAVHREYDPADQYNAEW